VIIGAHTIVYSEDADADRAFLRDVLGFQNVDAGHGWLIFALPPSEVAVHPSDENDKHELYLMTDDVEAEMARLEALGVTCAPISEQRWGRLTSLALPGGGKLGLYQPKHPMAIKGPFTAHA
jgi:catechol 2,3-dioxygenase-like lactoylglutathione lyase family enzyme